MTTIQTGDHLSPAEYQCAAARQNRHKLEDRFAAMLAEAGLDDGVQREYRFARPRRWRFDFAWPALFVAVEIQGGTYNKGRHVRGAGYKKDCDKSNAAVARGWLVLRFTGAHLTKRATPATIALIRGLLNYITAYKAAEQAREAATSPLKYGAHEFQRT